MVPLYQELDVQLDRLLFTHARLALNRLVLFFMKVR